MFSSRFIRPAVSTFTRATPRPIITNTPSIASRFFTTSSPKMTVHEITSLANFKEAIANNHFVVIDAWATWCGPCRVISPIFEKFSNSNAFPTVYFAKVDVDAVPDLAQELGIRAMPTFIAFKDGEKVQELVGANPGGLETLLNNLRD